MCFIYKRTEVYNSWMCPLRSLRDTETKAWATPYCSPWVGGLLRKRDPPSWKFRMCASPESLEFYSWLDIPDALYGIPTRWNCVLFLCCLPGSLGSDRVPAGLGSKLRLVLWVTLEENSAFFVSKLPMWYNKWNKGLEIHNLICVEYCEWRLTFLTPHSGSCLHLGLYESLHKLCIAT